MTGACNHCARLSNPGRRMRMHQSRGAFASSHWPIGVCDSGCETQQMRDSARDRRALGARGWQGVRLRSRKAGIKVAQQLLFGGQACHSSTYAADVVAMECSSDRQHLASSQHRDTAAAAYQQGRMCAGGFHSRQCLHDARVSDYGAHEMRKEEVDGKVMGGLAREGPLYIAED